MKTEFTRSLGFLLLAAMFWMTVGQPASAATVSLKVETVEAGGPSVETPIATGPCEGLGALQFDLTYDPTVVEPESVEPGSALPNGMVEFKVKKPGVLGIALISSAPVDGSGTLLNVRFKPVAVAGGSTALGISGEKAWDFKNHLEMLVVAEPGTLRLTSGDSVAGSLPKNDLMIPLLIGATGLVLAILIIALARRGRNARAAAPSKSASNPSDGVFCEQCGARYGSGARFCPGCGRPINPPA